MTECDAVSVVIPTRDRSRVVAGTVQRTLAQRRVELEVIVVDDGSREAPAEALEALPLGHQLRDDLEAIGHAADRASTLAYQLLSFARKANPAPRRTGPRGWPRPRAWRC